MTDTSRNDEMLAALRRSPLVTRLKGVSQAGAPALFKPTRSVTRYEHSVGVMRLAQRLGLPAHQQRIALLHDATHSAFSHTVDYLVANKRENTHEQHAGRLLTDPDLTNVLSADAFAAVVDAITTKPAWLRMLDAVDYTLRDLIRARLIERTIAAELLQALVVIDGNICFATREAAQSFVTLMTQAGTRLYADEADLYQHWALAQLLTDALDRHVLTMDDIMTADDATVLDRLRRDPRLGRRLAAFRSQRPSNLRERRDGRRIASKPRVADPPVQVSATGVVPLSELDPAWRRARDAAERRAEHGVALLTPS